MITVYGQCAAAFVFGTTVGVLVQRSRWCNTAALRDAMLFKSYRNTKALLVAMMILTVGFTGMISIGNGNPMRFDVGINQFIGLFLFGIGMVFAGACTVSSWVKTGEGNIGALWALLFLIVGLFLSSLVWSFSYWPLAGPTMTGHANAAGLQFGWADALTLQRDTGVPAIVFGVIQTGALYALYRRILRRERATLAAEAQERPMSSERAARPAAGLADAVVNPASSARDALSTLGD